MKRTLSLFLTVMLIALLCVMFCHEAFHNDADGGLCVICSWIVSIRTLLLGVLPALAVGSSLLVCGGRLSPCGSSRAYRLPDTPVLLHDKLSD